MDPVIIERLTLEIIDGIVMVEVVAVEINTHATAREFGAELESILQAKPADRLLLDFSRVRYLSSTAFAVLLGFGRRAAEAGLQLRITGLLPAVFFSAEVLGLGRIIPIHASKTDAIASFSA